MRYRVTYARNGRERNIYFNTLDEARRVVDDYFRRTKIVLGIVAVPDRNKAVA